MFSKSAHGNNLEQEKFDDAVLLSKKNPDHVIAFQGMSPREAAAAMAARDRGQLHHAQMQRLLLAMESATCDRPD